MNTSQTQFTNFTKYPLENLTQLDWDTVSYSGAIMFTPSGKIVCIRQERGIDIAGGHRDPGESPQETVQREVKEEIGYDIHGSQVILIKEGLTSYRGINKPKLVYSLVENCEESVILGSFEQRSKEHADEVSSICFLDPEEFLQEYRSTRTRPEELGFIENMEDAIRGAVQKRTSGEKLHVGLIALGDHQIRGHLLPLEVETRVSEVLAFDLDVSKAVTSLQKQGISFPGQGSKLGLITSQLTQILGDSSISAVFISSPDQFHIPQMTEFLQAGRHVFCEKPLIHHPLEVPKLIENIVFAKQKGLILSSCHPRRFDRPFVWLKEYLSSSNNQIGVVKELHFHFSYPIPEEGKEGLHSGLLSDHFNHEIDLVTFYLGWDHFFVEKLSDSQTEYEARGIREDGVKFIFTGERNRPRGEKYAESITIFGSTGKIRVDTERGLAELITDDNVSTVIKQGLETDYIGRFQKTTSNFIDAIVAGGRNYLTGKDLLMNNLSGAILSMHSSFSSRDYLDLVEEIS